MENSIPGLDLPWPNRRQRWFLWPYQALRVSSTDPSKWIAPFRETIALETYKAYNTALARSIPPLPSPDSNLTQILL